MGTSGTKRGTKEVPREWLDSVARHIDAWIVATGRHRLTGRQLAPVLGISQPTLTQLLNRKGGLGITVLLSLRNALGKSIDDLLGLPPLAEQRPNPATMSEADVRRAVREELAALQAESGEDSGPGVASAPKKKRAQR